MAINFNPGLTAGSINTLNSVQRSSETNYQQLSTGQRINSAADDAAGLSIATRIDASSRSLQIAFRNANDGISMLQVADGALSQSTDILSRMRELTLQGANGTYTDSDRAALDKEYEQLAQELERIQTTTSFNGNTVFSGESVSLQVGAEANERIDFSLDTPDMAKLAGGSELSTADRLNAIDNTLDQLSQNRADIGAANSRLESATASLSNTNLRAQETKSGIMDTDFGVASAEKARLDIQRQVTIALLSQANANKSDVLRFLST
ncbi:MAG: flagellin FliC [Oceanospirillaceae bacterium]|nr:flagellin FliC [Oceanospirillaceae bacterium]